MTRDEELYVESLRDDLSSAGKLLRGIEWTGYQAEEGWLEERCPSCEATEAAGHRGDCPFPLLLRRIETT